MNTSFVQLTGVKGIVLFPRSAEVISITEDSQYAEPDTYWVSVRILSATDHFIDKSFHVKGPAQDIVNALTPVTCVSEEQYETLKAQFIALQSQAYEYEVKMELQKSNNKAQWDKRERDYGIQLQQVFEQVKKLETECLELHSRYIARVSLDIRESQWDNPNLPPGGVPALWSTYKLNPTYNKDHNTHRLFAASLGMKGQGFGDVSLQKEHTNIRESGRIPNGQGYVVFGVKVELLEGEAEDIAAVRKNAVLSWDMTQAVVDICTLGAMTWDETGKNAWYQFGSNSPVAKKLKHQADPKESSAEEKWVVSGPLASVIPGGRPLEIPPIPPRNANYLFTFGGLYGVRLPGAATFAILLHSNAKINGPVVVRVTLFGYYPTEIEIG
jgi:hypothetical protein